MKQIYLGGKHGSVGLKTMVNRRNEIERLESDLSAAKSRIAELEEQNKKYWFMIEHGLGVEDMTPPSYPHQ